MAALCIDITLNISHTLRPILPRLSTKIQPDLIDISLENMLRDCQLKLVR